MRGSHTYNNRLALLLQLSLCVLVAVALPVPHNGQVVGCDIVNAERLSVNITVELQSAVSLQQSLVSSGAGSVAAVVAELCRVNNVQVQQLRERDKERQHIQHDCVAICHVILTHASHTHTHTLVQMRECALVHQQAQAQLQSGAAELLATQPTMRIGVVVSLELLLSHIESVTAEFEDPSIDLRYRQPSPTKHNSQLWLTSTLQPDPDSSRSC